MNVMRVASLVALLGSVGCSITPHKYEADVSRAMNIYRAGCHIDVDLRDSKDGMDSYGKPFLSKVMDVAGWATIASRPALGFGQVSGTVVNAINIMATPENYSGRPFLMAWVPKSSAANKEEAKKRLMEAVDTALLNTAKDMNVRIEAAPKGAKLPKLSGVAFSMWQVVAPQYGCDDWNCAVMGYAHESEVNNWPTPEFLFGSMESESYRFAGYYDTKYPRVLFWQEKDKERRFPEKDFYTALSKHLPAWVALYFPPGSIYQEGKPITYPVVFEKGEMLLFKSPS